MSNLKIDIIPCLSDNYSYVLSIGKDALVIDPSEALPIIKFLEKNPNGGMHHICYEVINLKNASEKLELAGARILGDGKPKIGAHGNPVLFLHPADFAGTLIELEEIRK